MNKKTPMRLDERCPRCNNYNLVQITTKFDKSPNGIGEETLRVVKACGPCGYNLVVRDDYREKLYARIYIGCAA